MTDGKTIGMALFIGGIVLLIGYGIVLGFEDLADNIDRITGLLLGTIIIGLVILIISIVSEQMRDSKATMAPIAKEDLEP